MRNFKRAMQESFRSVWAAANDR